MRAMINTVLRDAHGHARPASAGGAVAACAALVLACGCESLQKKLIRKSGPHERSAPIISFKDYTQAMTPLDRYQKHALLFNYWNGELLDALGSGSLNAKRIARASEESLNELRVLQGLLVGEQADRLGALIEARARITQQLDQSALLPSRVMILRQTLERHTRQMNREFGWRDMEEHLQTQTSPPAADAPSD